MSFGISYTHVGNRVRERFLPRYVPRGTPAFNQNHATSLHKNGKEANASERVESGALIASYQYQLIVGSEKFDNHPSMSPV